MMMDANAKSGLYTALRQVCYLGGALVLMFLQWWIAPVFHNETFEESNIVENLQVAFLGTALLFFLVRAYLHKSGRSICLLCASLCALASCRELDETLDELLPIVSWRVGFLFPVLAICYAFLHRNGFCKTLILFCRMPCFTMLFQAVLIILMAQMIGHNAFIKTILMESEHIHSIKELFEEAAELMGYYVILCASIDLLFEPKQP